jgi:hypothetical protein
MGGILFLSEKKERGGGNWQSGRRKKKGGIMKTEVGMRSAEKKEDGENRRVESFDCGPPWRDGLNLSAPKVINKKLELM